MKINLFKRAEQRLREHLQSNRNDDDEAAMLAIKPGLIEDFGSAIAIIILKDPSWPDRILIIRRELYPNIVPEIY
jgi:hypothetical protein